MTFSLRVRPASSATVRVSASPQVKALSVDARVHSRPSQSTGLAHSLAHRRLIGSRVRDSVLEFVATAILVTVCEARW